MFDVFSCGVISTLRNQEEGEVDKRYTTLLDCLCSWGRVGHILELICDWLPEEQPQSKVHFCPVSLKLLNDDTCVLEIVCFPENMLLLFF